MSKQNKTATAKTEAKPVVTSKKAAPQATVQIRKPQARILQALAKSKQPMTRAQIAEKAPVDNAMCTEYLGANDPAKRQANDVKHFPSLLSLGFIQLNEGVYSITPAGKTASKATK